MLGKRLFRSVMKATVFGQFLGGEAQEEVLLSAQKLADQNLLAMVMYLTPETHGHTWFKIE